MSYLTPDQVGDWVQASQLGDWVGVGPKYVMAAGPASAAVVQRGPHLQSFSEPFDPAKPSFWFERIKDRPWCSGRSEVVGVLGMGGMGQSPTAFAVRIPRNLLDPIDRLLPTVSRDTQQTAKFALTVLDGALLQASRQQGDAAAAAVRNGLQAVVKVNGRSPALGGALLTVVGHVQRTAASHMARSPEEQRRFMEGAQAEVDRSTKFIREGGGSGQLALTLERERAEKIARGECVGLLTNPLDCLPKLPKCLTDPASCIPGKGGLFKAALVVGGVVAGALVLTNVAKGFGQGLGGRR